MRVIEELWNEYLSAECSIIHTEEERTLIKAAAELHEKVNALLSQAQKTAVEKYIDSLFDIQSFSTKKAFLKGCEFGVTFLLECTKPE